MKYVLLILPFMWGCAEKKEYPVYVVAGRDTMIFYKGNTNLTKCRASSSSRVNIDTDSAYEVYEFERHKRACCGTPFVNHCPQILYYKKNGQYIPFNIDTILNVSLGGKYSKP